MAKKLGKLLLFSAVTGAVAAGVYYYLNKKEDNSFNDEDFDDLDDFDLVEDDTTDSRNYVSLDLDNPKTESESNVSSSTEGKSSPAASSPSNQVEEFFDEDDTLSSEFLDKADSASDLES